LAGYDDFCNQSTYFEFTIDSSKATNVGIVFDAIAETGWSNPNNNTIYAWGTASGGAYGGILNGSSGNNTLIVSENLSQP
jgi:hypothetical protein